MSFTDDMKIGGKRVGGFLIVLLILVGVEGISYRNLQTVAADENALYAKMQSCREWQKGDQQFQVRCENNDR
jgi:CHASE3 domain sensor protein